MIGHKKEVELDGRVYQVREFTPNDVRNMLIRLKGMEKEGEVIDPVNEILFEMGMAEVAAMVNMTISEMQNLPNNTIRRLIEVGKEVNPDFFAFRGKLLRRPVVTQD